MALVPEKLINFRVYGGTGGTEQLGITDVELPSLEPMTETIMGAGIAGEYESPVLGHFKSMKATLKWRQLTALGVAFLSSATQRLDLRGSGQILNSESGALATVALRLDVRGPMTKGGLGKFEVGKPMECDVSIEVFAISLFIANAEVLAFDRHNFSYRVLGVEQLATVRADLGG